MDEKSLRALFLSAIRTVSAGAVLMSCAAPRTQIKLSPTSEPSSAAKGASIVSMPVTMPIIQPNLPPPFSTDESAPPSLANQGMDYSVGGFQIKSSGKTQTIDYIEIDSKGFGETCSNAKDKTRCEEKYDKQRAKMWEERTNPAGNPFYNEKIITTNKDAISTMSREDFAALQIGAINSANQAALHLWLESEGHRGLPTHFGETKKGYVLRYSVEGPCGDGFEEILVKPSGEQESLAYQPGRMCRGRRPDGLCEPEAPEAKTAGEFFAEAAWQEAVSVPAFHSLARDLRLLNAPEHLIEAALVSAQDEIRHEQQMTRLAHREGAQVTVPPVEEKPPKDLFALAVENEREGCVNETFAALLAWHQATNADDARVARELQSIAADETRHAALAFQVREWLLPQLTPEQQEAVRQVRQQTIAALRANPQELPDETAKYVGWPSRQQSLALLDLVASPLWS